MKNLRWKIRPDGSTWGDWGADDQLGRLNLIDKAQVLKGVKEVSIGKTFCLSLPLDLPGKNILSPVRFPPRLNAVTRNQKPYYNYEWNKHDSRFNDIAADDFVVLHTQYSTQWDSLAHRGSMFDVDGTGVKKPVYYNGYAANQDINIDSNENVKANYLGIEHMANHGVQGRGVMINLKKYFGISPQKEVNFEDLMGIINQEKIKIEQGDIVCFWTGFDELLIKMNGNPDPKIKEQCSVLDGWDKKLLNWISKQGIAAIVSDNLAVELIKKDIPKNYQGSNLPLHEHCLFKLGIHLGELWHLSELAKWLDANNRYRFLLTAPPLRLTGAVGSPVTPIATV